MPRVCTRQRPLARPRALPSHAPIHTQILPSLPTRITPHNRSRSPLTRRPHIGKGGKHHRKGKKFNGRKGKGGGAGKGHKGH